MAARDRYAVKVECSDCGVTGRVHLSENDYPFMSRVDREIDSVDGEFSASLPDAFSVLVTCKQCGREVKSM